MTNRKPTHDLANPLLPLADFGIMAKEQSSQKPNGRKEKSHTLFVANILADNAPYVLHNNAIKPISMTCRDKKSFFFSPDVAFAS